jgi:hypothetical protein
MSASLTSRGASDAPTVPAYRDGGILLIICPFCGKTHSHGAPAGHRRAHCLPNSLGYYELRESAETPPPEIQRQMVKDAGRPASRGRVSAAASKRNVPTKKPVARWTRHREQNAS